MGPETHVIVDDLDALLAVLPPDLCTVIRRLGRRDDLLEVILDLGRVPTARYTDQEVVLREQEITRAEIDYVVERVGQFDADNRAGIPRTLHRIAAVRNRRGDVVGLTCRVGRAVYGTIAIIQDLITSGKSVLLLGRPAVGKTTMLREAARVLAENRRVIIVDTSNEIGGDGDIPHPAIGRARRMQVAVPNLQHEVMIEAVENHNPEVIVIDEIGRELEAEAARTIAERGVQLIATAHGNSLENLLLNPTLSDLVGGIESVTLSDEEARRRGTQKTVLERRSPPTFDILVEIQDRQRLIVHPDVASAVDTLLRGGLPRTELRTRNAAGEIETTYLVPDSGRRVFNGHSFQTAEPGLRGGGRAPRHARSQAAEGEDEEPAEALIQPPHYLPIERTQDRPARATSILAIHPYGVARDRLIAALASVNAPARLVESLSEADLLLTTRQIYRRRPAIIRDAEKSGLPVYALRANTMAQIEVFIEDLFELSNEEDGALARAARETEEAIRRINSGADEVELSPQNAYIRRRQHEMARAANLESESTGREPHRRVKIYRP